MIIPELYKDFRNFVYATHPFIKLPAPTQLQYKISEQLQHGPERLVLMAFRGASKSHLAALYCIWRLYKNKEEKILVVSATANKAKQFVSFAKKVIDVCPFLQHMKDDSPGLSYEFNVANVEPSQNPSLSAKGLTSQITGDRATIIIADDVEISTTTSSEARDKIEHLSAEFEDILIPDRDGTRIIYLGTPHDSSSFYNRLASKGYTIEKYPIYDENGVNQEPGRFSDEDLEKRRVSKGDSLFQLQYMLDTSKADMNRFPLRLSDLIVSPDFKLASCREEYRRTTSEYSFAVKEGKGSDRLYVSEADGFEVPYTKIILALDPAGAGADSFSYHILATRNSFIFSLAHGRWSTGLNRQVMHDIQAMTAKYKVNEIVVETNFGDDLLLNMLKPNVRVPVIPVKHSTQKEKRIISTLEPLLNQRKLVVGEDFISDETLMSQFCNLTSVRGCLRHDDEIDVLAIGVNHLNANLNINLKAMRDAEYQERLDKEIEQMMGVDSSLNWIN